MEKPMRLDNLKYVESLKERRDAAIRLRNFANAPGADVKGYLGLGSEIVQLTQSAPKDLVLAAFREIGTDEIVRVEAELARFGVVVDKPEPVIEATAESWKRQAGMYERAWRRELGHFLGNNRHLIDALVTGTANLRRAAEKPLLWASDFLEWAAATFGPIARDKRERGLRFLEESIEVAQAAGVEKEAAELLVGRTYSRPPGNLDKELGQAQACLAMLSFVADADAMANAKAEFARCKKIPKEEWARRHAAKVAIGIAS